MVHDFLESFPEVYEYLPDAPGLHKIPRSFLITIAHSVIKDPFKKWAAAKVEDRNEKRKLI